VLQFFVEQLWQAEEEVCRRLLPPPMPKEENRLVIFLLWQ